MGSTFPVSALRMAVHFRFSNQPPLHFNRGAPGGRAPAGGGGLLSPHRARPDPLRGVHGGPQRTGDPHGLLELGRPGQDYRYQVRGEAAPSA